MTADVVEHGPRRQGPAVRLSDPVEAQLAQLDQFLLDHMYRSHRLVRADAKARRIVTAIFDAYVAEPRLMPPRYHGRVETQGVRRVVTDYLAGMTDRYCLLEYSRLFDARTDA